LEKNGYGLKFYLSAKCPCKLKRVFGLTGSNGMRYGPRYPVGDVGQQRPDDGTHQRGERAADSQQQMD